MFGTKTAQHIVLNIQHGLKNAATLPEIQLYNTAHCAEYTTLDHSDQLVL